MKLAIYGREDIKNLEKWAHEIFEKIENKNIERPKYREIPFDKDNLCHLVKIVPTKDEDYLYIDWVVEWFHP